MDPSPAQDGVHPSGDVLLALLKDVPVGVRRQHDRAVPQEVLDVLQGEALTEQERRRRVAQVVEARVGESGSHQRPTEGMVTLAPSTGVPSVVVNTWPLSTHSVAVRACLQTHLTTGS